MGFRDLSVAYEKLRNPFENPFLEWLLEIPEPCWPRDRFEKPLPVLLMEEQEKRNLEWTAEMAEPWHRDRFEKPLPVLLMEELLMEEQEKRHFLEVELAEGGIDIKVGSATIHVPKHCSVRHPAVQMVLFAEVCMDFFYCLHSLVPRVIIDIIEKSSSDSCSNAGQTVYKAGWADARGHSTKSHIGDAISHLRSQKVDLQIDRINWGPLPVLFDVSMMSERLTSKVPPSHETLDTYALATTEAQTPGDGNRMPALWLDSGAGHHAVGDASVLCNFRDPPAGAAVRVADGFQLPVTKIGDIWTDIFQIPEVYLVPGLQMNVISVRQLARCRIFPTFYENHADLYRDGEQVGGAIVDDNVSIYRLYYLAAVGNVTASTS